MKHLSKLQTDECAFLVLCGDVTPLHQLSHLYRLSQRNNTKLLLLQYSEAGASKNKSKNNKKSISHSNFKPGDVSTNTKNTKIKAGESSLLRASASTANSTSTPASIALGASLGLKRCSALGVRKRTKSQVDKEREVEFDLAAEMLLEELKALASQTTLRTETYQVQLQD